MRGLPLTGGSSESENLVSKPPTILRSRSHHCGKRMHFVREKRDKPPGRRFHVGKRLSEKRDKREKTYSPGYSFSVSVSAISVWAGQPEGRASTR